MTAARGPNAINAEFAKALGIDITDLSRVRSVTLTLRDGELPRVIVERFVMDGDAALGALRTVMQNHRLVAIDTKGDDQ